MMDLTIDCPHCSAKAGEICTKDCEVNGKKIDLLEKILISLDMTLENITMRCTPTG